MKKILLFIVALVATLSMNAQTTEFYEGTTLKKAYYGADVTVSFGGNSITVKQGATEDTYNGSSYKVVSKELPPSTGKAKATIGGKEVDVNWIQLWENGPKFAEYNVGVTDGKAESYGGYYCWGKATDKDPQGAYNDGTSALTGTDDTATALWGSNWRMPTADELGKKVGLLAKCTCKWITLKDAEGQEVKGVLCTGKAEPYTSNSIFLPTAGRCESGKDIKQGLYAMCWSSTPYDSGNAYALACSSSGNSGYCTTGYRPKNTGYSVRAVLKEPTTGTAKATINSSEVDVNWVQLWENGPKFADRNVGASSATDAGTEMTFTDAIKTGTDYVWGTNWCTPSKEGENDGMNELLLAAQGNSDSKVTCVYTQENSTWGFKFTGKGAYASNSVFFPARRGSSDRGNAYYWSGTADDSRAWSMRLNYNRGLWDSTWDSYGQDISCYVRPVLKN